MAKPEDLAHLLRNLEFALEQGLGPEDLVPMLTKLVATAPGDTPESHYCKLKLAELVVQAQPWRAARLARQVAISTGAPEAWALLGLSHTVLGHHRAAAKAYREAMRGAPNDPLIAHNLGHLLDVALGRPNDAVGLLHAAHLALPMEEEISSSLAHALLGAGLPARAATILEAAMGPRAASWLRQWEAEMTDDAPTQLPDSSDPHKP